MKKWLVAVATAYLAGLLSGSLTQTVEAAPTVTCHTADVLASLRTQVRRLEELMAAHEMRLQLLEQDAAELRARTCQAFTLSTHR